MNWPGRENLFLRFEWENLILGREITSQKYFQSASCAAPKEAATLPGVCGDQVTKVLRSGYKVVRRWQGGALRFCVTTRIANISVASDFRDGTRDSSVCPPEGGRDTDPTRSHTDCSVLADSSRFQ